MSYFILIFFSIFLTQAINIDMNWKPFKWVNRFISLLADWVSLSCSSELKQLRILTLHVITKPLKACSGFVSFTCFLFKTFLHYFASLYKELLEPTFCRFLSSWKIYAKFFGCYVVIAFYINNVWIFKSFWLVSNYLSIFFSLFFLFFFLIYDFQYPLALRGSVIFSINLFWSKNKSYFFFKFHWIIAVSCRKFFSKIKSSFSKIKSLISLTDTFVIALTIFRIYITIYRKTQKEKNNLIEMKSNIKKE